MPDVAGNGLSFGAPSIERVNYRLQRVVAWLVDRRVLNIRLMIDLLAVFGVP